MVANRRELPDRREGPQRLEEVKLHYAGVATLAAAIAVSDHRAGRRPGETIADGLALLRQQDEAVDAYHAAEADALAAREAAS